MKKSLVRIGAGGVLLLVALVLWWLLRPLGHAVPRARSAVSAATLHDPALIARGAYLAKVGDCAACHTTQGGKPYAGGRMLPTPFGGIATSNLTPDPATGLGHWSFEDFWQALHRGIGRDGEPLYPAFPYPSYTKVSHDDALALFAYLQSLPAVRQAATPDTLSFPYNLRRLLVVWRALYFDEGTYRNDPAQSAVWNRGAYLVQGLGHCAECHASRNALGAVKDARMLAGGEIPEQFWYAPDLGVQGHGGLAGWSARDITDLLKVGHSARGAAFGPMADVVRESTQHYADADLAALAAYLATLPPRNVPAPRWNLFDAKRLARHGADIYAQHCADCHGGNGRGVAGIYPPLVGNASVTEPSGLNAIRVVLLGGFMPATAGNPRPYSMPPYAQQLNDIDVASVVSYIRMTWGNHAGAVSPQDVSRYRHTPVD